MKGCCYRASAIGCSCKIRRFGIKPLKRRDNVFEFQFGEVEEGVELFTYFCVHLLLLLLLLLSKERNKSFNYSLTQASCLLIFLFIQKNNSIIHLL